MNLNTVWTLARDVGAHMLARREAAAATSAEDEKLKAKRAKLEAWKKEREAKKALDSAKAKAMALAGKGASGESFRSTVSFSISQHLISH